MILNVCVLQTNNYFLQTGINYWGLGLDSISVPKKKNMNISILYNLHVLNLKNKKILKFYLSGSSRVKSRSVSD